MSINSSFKLRTRANFSFLCTYTQELLLAVFSWYNNVRRQPYRADNGRCSFRFASEIRSYCKTPKNARHNLYVQACFAGGIIKSSSARIEKRRCRASRIYSLIVPRKRARRPKRTFLESTKNSRDDTAVTNLIYNDVKVPAGLSVR